MKTIAEQIGVKEFPFEIKDKDGNQIYYEDSCKYWEKRKYNSQGRQIYYEDSDGYWCKDKFDSKGNRIYFEDSNGYLSKTEYDSEGNIIYYENPDGVVVDCRIVPEYTMEELVEKIGNFKIKK